MLMYTNYGDWLIISGSDDVEFTCPNCGDKVYQVRSDLDIFRCTNDECGWYGNRDEIVRS